MENIRHVLAKTNANTEPIREPNYTGSVNNIEEIKYHIRTMPYGDFMDMANAIGADTTKMWGWAQETLL